MKKLLLTAALAVIGTMGGNAAVLIQYDFAGATATAASNSAVSTFAAAGVAASNMTRGAGLSANNAANSFRGTGFSNDGISTANTDYAQFTLASTAGNTVSVTSLTGNYNGTGTFMNSPGVTLAYAYSLDNGVTFTLMSSFNRTGAGTATYTLSAGEATALSNVTSVIFRMYASGQTTTGGFGLQSAATVGTIGLQIDGSVAAVPEPSTYALIGMGVISLVVLRRMKKSSTKA